MVLLASTAVVGRRRKAVVVQRQNDNERLFFNMLFDIFNSMNKNKRNDVVFLVEIPLWI
jgi:hypothetical protein